MLVPTPAPRALVEGWLLTVAPARSQGRGAVGATSGEAAAFEGSSVAAACWLLGCSQGAGPAARVLTAPAPAALARSHGFGGGVEPAT